MERIHAGILRVAAILVLGLAVGGCNGGDLAALSGLQDGNDDPKRQIDPGNPHNDNSDVPDPETYPNDWDQDGDGIPDEDDYIPCMAFYVKVWNQNVSSASVILNDQVIVDESAFPTDEIIVEYINPTPGVNTIELGGKLAGSPEDQLHIEIWDSDGNLYLHETAIRESGSPENWSVSFLIEVQC